MNRFNLIDKSWIPVRFLAGQRDELGIRQTLERADEIAAIEDASPLVVVALHRFLLAILYRALEGPADIDQAMQLFNEGIPRDRVLRYLDEWFDRFDLFDEVLPFGQIVDFEPKAWRAWTVLATEHNADNAKVLFDHVEIAAAGTIPAAAAARWLLATQTFSISSANSELAYTRTAPSAASALTMPIGRSLQDTLLLSLVPQNRAVLANDLPVWERSSESLQELKDGIERPVAGLCDLYTWRARTIRFAAGDIPSVGKVAFASGVAVTVSGFNDPMVAYRVDEKNGRLPIQFHDRGLWRDFDSLLPDGGQLEPRVIAHAATLARCFRERMPLAISVFGQANHKAKIEFWRMERFSFPAALSGHADIRAEIRELLELAENTEQSLWAACRDFARALLSRRDARDARDAREPAQQDVSRFVRQMAAIPCFWSVLESRFQRMLGEFCLDHDRDDIRLGWLIDVRNALRDAWDQHRAAAAIGDAWTLRALVKAEQPVRRKLAELGRKIAELEPRGDAA